MIRNIKNKWGLFILIRKRGWNKTEYYYITINCFTRSYMLLTEDENIPWYWFEIFDKKTD